MNSIDIIGIGMGPQDLTQGHKELIRNCELLVGGSRHLSMFPDYTGETFKITGDIPGLVRKIKTEMVSRKIVVLASGDPLFYGIGNTLSRHISKKFLTIHANVSCVASAFARICQPWDDAMVISLHSGLHDDLNFSRIFRNHKLAFLTSPDRDPAYITTQMHRHQETGFSICVLENLGDPDREKIRWFSDPTKVMDQTFSHPNLVILLRQDTGKTPPSVSHETYLGMPDAFFSQSNGLITKSEVRVLSLSKLKLAQKDHVLWDIGSGSGSVGIEAALMLPQGQVHAIEKNKNRIADIKRNIDEFHMNNITINHMEFPGDTAVLKRPDRIFIGGGGGNLEQIIDCCCNHLNPGGIIVINTVVIDNMTVAMKALSKQGMLSDMIQVQISRSAPIAGGHRLSPLNPVWIISGTKPS